MEMGFWSGRSNALVLLLTISISRQAHMLQGSSVGSLNDVENYQMTAEVTESRENHEPSNEAIEECQELGSIEQTSILINSNENQGLNLHQLEPFAASILHNLVSLVHDSVKLSAPDLSSKSNCMKDVVHPSTEHKYAALDDSFLFEKDPVASILSSVEPPILQIVMLAMVRQFPRTLEALIIHMLSPAAAEVLTRKFEEMDQLTTSEQQSEFYQQFYSVFDDQYAAMDAILNGKESFAFQAFRRVMDQYVGVTVEKPK